MHHLKLLSMKESLLTRRIILFDEVCSKYNVNEELRARDVNRVLRDSQETPKGEKKLNPSLIQDSP